MVIGEKIPMAIKIGEFFQKSPHPNKCESMENALKIKVFRKSILFCKYLRNGSSDLYEILCAS